MKQIAIVGAGLMGRLCALSLRRLGHDISLYDKDNRDGHLSAARAAAGLLTPLGESFCCDPWVVNMGFAALERWPILLNTLKQKVFFQQEGTLVLAHQQDSGDLLRFSRHLDKYWSHKKAHWLGASEINELEPQLAKGFAQGLYLPQEGQISGRDLLTALAFELEELGVKWYENTQVEQVEPHKVWLESGKGDESCEDFDWVIDCRGLGANKQLTDLRGVRGEVFLLDAPEVELNRPVRLVHPRYQLYIAPKPNHQFMVGATEIESDDMGPMTVRSALELLSAAYSVHSGFAEARIVEQISQCRPAFSDNHPQIQLKPGLMSVNGLYRHGYLLAPVVLDHVMQLLESGIGERGIDSEFEFSQMIKPEQVNDLQEAS